MIQSLYELMVIVSPVLTETQANQVLDEIKQHLKETTFEEVWGKRRLAYPIKKQHEGFYAVWNFSYGKQDLAELNEFLRLHPQILRHLLITVPKDYAPMKRSDMEQGVSEYYEAKKKKQKSQQRPLPAATASRPSPKKTTAEEAPAAKAAKPAKAAAEVPKEKEAIKEAKAAKETKAPKSKDKDDIDEKLDKILFGDDLNF